MKKIAESSMDRKNFEGQVFDELPAEIVCSNFKNCTFNAASKFDRCNLMKCDFTKDQYFLKSNVLGCTGVDGSVFDHSSNDPDWEEEMFHHVDHVDEEEK